MPHPVMFSEHDPGLADVRAIALAFPGAFEKISWGRPVFCAPKMFAVYGGSEKAPAEGGAKGDHVPYPHALLIKVDDSDRRALAADRRFFFPAYLGPFGWLGMDFTAAEVDWTEVRELLDASYRMVAPKKMLRQLDQRQSGHGPDMIRSETP